MHWFRFWFCVGLCFVLRLRECRHVGSTLVFVYVSNVLWTTFSEFLYWIKERNFFHFADSNPCWLLLLLSLIPHHIDQTPLMFVIDEKKYVWFFQRTSFKSSIQNLAQSYFNFSFLSGLRRKFQFQFPLKDFYAMAHF